MGNLLIHAFFSFLQKLTLSDICRVIDLYYKIKDHANKK